MAEETDDPMPERLPSSRADIKRGVIEALDIKGDARAAIVIGLGRYIHDIDGRAERIETKPGTPT